MFKIFSVGGSIARCLRGTGVSTAASRLFGTLSFLSTSYAIESRWYSMGNSAFSCVSRSFKASSRSLGYSARCASVSGEKLPWKSPWLCMDPLLLVSITS